MTAADIIAREFRYAHRKVCYPDALDFERELFGMSVLSALSDAGYRILAPDEMDAKTVEACAKLAEADADEWVGQNGGAACIAIAAAIRALAKTGDAP